MSPVPDSREFYRQLIAERGIDQATDFSDPGQQTRFAKILECIPLSPEDERIQAGGEWNGDLECWRVLDYGCNVGDLWEYAQAHGRGWTYAGMDREEQFVNRLQARFGDVHEVWVGNIMDDTCYAQLRDHPFDYVVASGVLSHRDQTAQHRAMFERLWSLAKKGLVVNFLTCLRPDLVAAMKPMLSFYHPGVVLDWVTKLGIRQFVLHHGTYHTGNDFTVACYR